MGDILTIEKSALEEMSEKFSQHNTNIDAKLAEFGKKLNPETAAVEQKQLGGITAMEIWDIPIGKIAVGTFGGVFASELIDGFMAAQSDMVKGIAKLVSAGVTIKWGSRWFGRDAATAIAFVLGVLGFSQILPIDKWATQLAGAMPKIGGAGTIKSVGGPTVLTQAQQVAADYYAAAEGR